ncbi:MAG TPA: ACT domain-containing protein [Methanomassiliicoccales archaeon]|nr:ACT domain-containing protein [Methanomassiliicoccales archaeon]
MKELPQKESVAEKTRGYIDAHPSVKDCMVKDLINYSSLARLIMKEMGIKNEEAVMIACRRYAQKLSKKDHEGDILAILADSRLEVKTKICIVTANNDWTVIQRLERIFVKLINHKALMQVIQGAQAITIIADEKLRNDVVNEVGQSNVLRVRENLVEITVKSPQKIGETSGVFSYLSSNLAEQGVNMVETVSCYTDTIFIVDDKDMIQAYSLLSKLLESAEKATETRQRMP